VLDSRPTASTADGVMAGGGKLSAGAVLELPVAGRVGVPVDAESVVVNVTAVAADGAGFVTVWPCGVPQPNVSNLNVTAGQTIPNLVIVRVGTNGKICLSASAGTHLLADITGYFP
jgi:hypothetical protein